MWTFLKNKLTGFYRIPRYRLMESHAFPGRYYMWDRHNKYAAWYYNSMDEAMFHIESENIDCDPVKAFK